MSKTIIAIMIAVSFIAILGLFFAVEYSNNKYMNQISDIKLESNAFLNNQTIPKQYGCNGENISPELSINNVPIGTKSLALIVDDPDSMSGNFVHWLVWNIPAETLKIESGLLPAGSVQGLNDYKKNEYDGPCPPKGTHRYIFKLFALDDILNLNKNSNKNDLENTMMNHIIGQTELIGLYSR